jgi:arginase
VRNFLPGLLPPTSGSIATVDVDPPTDAELPFERGIVARTALLRQLASAERIIRDHSPERRSTTQKKREQ